jgi:hypothetical protein
MAKNYPLGQVYILHEVATGLTKQVLVDLEGNLVYKKPEWVKVKLEGIRNYLGERASFRK